MSERSGFSSGRIFLGIEAGGTRTVAVAAGGGLNERLNGNSPFRRIETGPANLILMSDEQLTRHLREIASAMPRVDVVAIGMAGARQEADRARVRLAVAKVWGSVPCYATNDLETALMAEKAERPTERVGARVLVLSGTGSCCFGRMSNGRTAKVGGRGHILGDKASGYDIGLRSLKAALYYYDCDGALSALGRRILRRLQLNEPDDLIDWIQSAGKKEIAALAPEVFAAAAGRDRIALDILASAASSLARDAVACASRLVKRGTLVHFILAGGVLLKQPRFAQQVGRNLRKNWPHSIVTSLHREGVWGAIELARQFGTEPQPAKARRLEQGWPHAILKDGIRPQKNAHAPTAGERQAALGDLISSPTERRNPRSMELDKLPLAKAIMLMIREDRQITSGLLKERREIEAAIRLVVRAFRQGGRLFYVGAGTSGRLGVLDASECPPTFGTSPEMVQGIIAGGQRALWDSVEAGEDDAGVGAKAISVRGLGRRDAVVGIAASGRTPFVWGALREAKRVGASTVLICFNPAVRIPAADRPTVVLAPNVGPEILTGSTRLKAGTATKLILNMITTLAMVRMGKVVSNLMVDVKASNTKLRDRATRIVQELTGADYARARAALEKGNWQIPAVCRVLKRAG